MIIKNTAVIVSGTKPSGARISADIPAGLVQDESRTRTFFRRWLRRAAALKASCAYVSIPAGIPGPDLKAAAKISAQEIFRVIHEGRTPLKKIVFFARDVEASGVFNKYALGYIDYIENRLKSPFLTVDAIIEYKGGIVLIKRSNPPFGWAIPGGFVDYGESLEKAAAREAKEETGLSLKGLKQLHTYSDPSRDPRFHTVCTVYCAKGTGKPRAGDDAADIRVAYPKELDTIDFAFNHRDILKDYFVFKSGKDPYNNGD